jgi:protein TonB
MRYARFAIAVFAGSILTLGLIFWMQALIATGKSPAHAARPITFVTPVLGRPVPPPPRKPRVKPPIDPEQQPEMTSSLDPAERTTRGGTPLSFMDGLTRPEGLRRLPRGADGPWAADGDFLLLTPIQPTYPAPAIRRGIEGVVVLEFTITKQGTTADIAVVRSSDHIFEAAAQSALARYRYEPRVVDGVPIDVPGVRVEFVFELDD